MRRLGFEYYSIGRKPVLPGLRAAPVRVLVTGGAGFIGSHLCDFLLAQGCEVVCMDNLLTGSTDNIAHISDPRFLFVKHDVTNYIVVDGPLDYVLHFASPASPDRLPGAAHPDPQGGRARHPQGARAGQGEARPLPARLHLRGLRRSARAPAARGLLGQRQPGGPARRLRRGQALRRGHDHGLPPRARPRRAHRAHLQHLRPAHAAHRRARDPHLRAPGAAGRAHDRLRRRLPDALLHLRLRPGRGHLAPDAGAR